MDKPGSTGSRWSIASSVEYTYAWSTGTNSWFVPIVVVLSCTM